MTDAETQARSIANRQRVNDRLRKVLTACRAEIGHPDIELAMRFSCWSVLCSLEAHTLHQAPSPALFPPATLVSELTRMCVSYLDLRPPGTSRH